MNTTPNTNIDATENENLMDNSPVMADTAPETVDDSVDTALEELQKSDEEGKFDPTSFDFGAIQMDEIKRAPSTKTTTKTIKQLNPNEGFDLRVFTNGAVYPSEAIVEELNLEYKSNTVLPADELDVAYKGYGFDIIDPADFISLKSAVKAGMPTDFIILGHTPRVDGKLDIFRSTRFNENDGSPKASVLDQGSPSELADLIKFKFGEDAFGDEDYVDVKILTDRPIPLPANGKVMVNKFTTKRSEDESEPVKVKTYTGRKNTTLFPIVIEAYRNENKEVAEPASETDNDPQA